METKHEASMARTLRAEQHQNTEDHHTTCESTNTYAKKTIRYMRFWVVILLTWFITNEYSWHFGSILHGNHAVKKLERDHDLFVGMLDAFMADDPGAVEKETWKTFFDRGTPEQINLFRGLCANGNAPKLLKALDAIAHVGNLRGEEKAKFQAMNKYVEENGLEAWIALAPLLDNKKVVVAGIDRSESAEEVDAAREAHEQNKILFMSAMLWDNTNELARVRLSDLPPGWVQDYPKLVDRLKETNSTNVLQHWDAMRIGVEAAAVSDHPLGGGR